MSSEEEQIAQRRSNLEGLATLGVEIYPRAFDRRDAITALVEAHGGRTHDELEADRPQALTGGRILAIRSFGKANFLGISDGHAKIQAYIRQDSLPPLDFEVFKLLDVGDWVGVEGRLFRTKTNELTIWASRLHFLSKCLLPLPEKWHGLTDVEIRYRQRYLDLVVNPDARHVFEVRSRVVAAIRDFMTLRGYLEVETPMMQPIAGGALARPFVTHHNTLEMDLFLRIAPELYLKRLTVGGFERVFEINRNFRNEGISTQHNPEFTMLEFYEAYSNYTDLMDLNEQLFAQLAQTITGSTTIRYGDVDLDFAKFTRLSMREGIGKYWPPAAGPAPTPAELAAPAGPRAATERYNIWAKSAGVTYAVSKGTLSDGEWTGLLFETIAEDKLVQPTILYEFPTDISPLSKQKPEDPSVTERFEIYVAGMEIA